MFRRKHPDTQPGPGVPPPPQDPGARRPRQRWTARRRRSVWLYAFALIGFLAVCFLLIRYIIVPLLVTLA